MIVQPPKVTPGKQIGHANSTLLLPMFRVLLHNDDKNSMEHVVKTLMQVFGWTLEKAVPVMKEAHVKGLALCGIWHFEAAEHYCDQLHSFSLSATMEPA